jgi:DNA-binding XRE family transcriptional regulator
MQTQNQKIQSNLKSLRASKNLTQDDIAEKLNITRTTYHKKEKGDIEFKQNEMIELSVIFNKTLNEIFLPDTVTNCNIQT